MDIVNYLKEKIKKEDLKTIVFPEGENLFIIDAALELRRHQLVNPILLGRTDEILEKMKSKGASIKDIRIMNPHTEDTLDYYIKKYCAQRMMPEAVGKKIIPQPLYFSAMMVKEGVAHGMVAGINHPTEEVIMASELIFGLQEDIHVPSSFYLLDIPGFKGDQKNLLVFADPSINPDPSPQELADIAYATALSTENLLGWEPKLAFLSFSTKGSANHPCVTKVKEAMEILNKKKCHFLYDGELQADAAINETIGNKKTKGSSLVAGKANILIFPNLDACNISSKLVQQLAHAKFYGPILQGFNYPVSDLSRGATVEDILGTALITATK